MRNILPSAKKVPDTICLKGSSLANLYGLPKTHKRKSAMGAILSAIATYMLAKLLDKKLKPPSINKYTISVPLNFLTSSIERNRRWRNSCLV